MLEINTWTFKLLEEHFSQNKITPYYPSRSWQKSRYIQISIPLQDGDLHYEYRIDHNWVGRVELHFEGDWEDKYGLIIDKLMDYTQNNEQLNWSEWRCGYRCQLVKKIDSPEDLIAGISYMMELFDNKIKEIKSIQPPSKPVPLETNDFPSEQVSTVDIQICTLEQLLRLPLSIPNYQRIYCWEEQNVKCLLDDVFEHLENAEKTNVTYRLGTVILHSHDGKYDIVDGQQRLITLSLLLYEIGVYPSLLDEKLSSKQSMEYVAYNKFYINKYIQRNLMIKSLKKRLLKSIDFSVLILKNTSLDLAYTFFSNLNARGVRLTDYDLLKAIFPAYQVISCAEATSNMSNLTGIIFGPRGDESKYKNIYDLMKDHRTNGFCSLIKRRFVIGSYVLQKENQERYYRNACRARRLLVDTWKNIFNDYDAIILPVGIGPAKKLDDNAKLDSNYTVLDEHLAVGNFGGFPSITIPDGFINDLPVALNITGNCYNDEEILGIASAIESLMPYKDQIAKEVL